MTAILTTAEQLDQLIEKHVDRSVEKAFNKQTNPNPEAIYTRAQAARKLGKSKPTIQRMIDQGRIQATADQKYISQKAINDYLNCK